MRVMGIIDDFSLKVIDGDVKNIEHEISNPTVGVLQMLCLERLSRKEKDDEKRPNLIIDGKELIRDDKIESFQNKSWFD